MGGEGHQTGFQQPQHILRVPAAGGYIQGGQNQRDERIGENIPAGIHIVRNAFLFQDYIQHALIVGKIPGRHGDIPTAASFPQQPADGSGGPGAFCVNIRTGSEGNGVGFLFQRFRTRDEGACFQQPKRFVFRPMILRQVDYLCHGNAAVLGQPQQTGGSADGGGKAAAAISGFL